MVVIVIIIITIFLEFLHKGLDGLLGPAFLLLRLEIPFPPPKQPFHCNTIVTMIMMMIIMMEIIIMMIIVMMIAMTRLWRERIITCCKVCYWSTVKIYSLQQS